MTQKRKSSIAILAAVLASIILTVVFLGPAGLKIIWLKSADIDYLYRNLQPEKAVNVPELKQEGLYTEINLKEYYRKSSLSESEKVSEKDKLAVINKWSGELYPYFGSFMLASAMDSLTYKVADGIMANSTSSEKTANSISLWALNRLVHTQQQNVFRNLPGRDPWGAVNIFEPTYKKVLPSEMLAKSVYTGNITGKCCSLAALNTGIFAAVGANPDDILILRYNSHNIGIVKYDGKLFVLNNQHIDPLNQKIKDYLLAQKYKGFFNYSISVQKSFRLKEEFFSAGSSLLEAVTNLTGTANQLPEKKLFAKKEMQNREDLLAQVFKSTGDEEHQRIFTLARYAYQSLYVNNPELYLKASVRAPVTKALAKKLHSEDGIVNWIKNNISCSPIFEDYEERLMLADQVIVFKKGCPKDQAVLAWSLLRLNGFKPVIKITKEAAYVEVNNRLYQANTWEIADAIKENVELELKSE